MKTRLGFYGVFVFLVWSVTINTWAQDYSSFTIMESQFSIRYEGGFSSGEKKKLYTWLSQAANAVTTLYKRFPEERVNIELIRNNAAEPVPWGQVHRERTPRVTFHVNPRYSLKNFQDDWVAVHEFSHLLLPYAGDEDTWVSEGLASYYQNVLRARHGMISEITAWRKLMEGFARGKADDYYQQLTLGQLSPAMRRTGSYMRVYWSGAAYFLMSDIEVRRISNGGVSLDLVLDKFNRCCRAISGDWTGPQIIKKLDELAKLNVFYPTYEKFKQSYSIPDTTTELESLGVSMEGDEVLLDSNAAWSRMRDAIM